MRLAAVTLAVIALPACYVPYTGATPSATYRVGGGMQWVDIRYAPASYRVDGWAPLTGPYYVLLDESQRYFCAVPAEIYAHEVDSHRLLPCAWRAVRP